MPNDLTVSAVKPAPPISLEGNAPSRGFEAAPPAAASPSYPNPAMHMDPALNLVVIEFHNAAGQMTDSTPTPRQLEAYRQTMRSPNAPTPVPTPTPQALPDK